MFLSFSWYQVNSCKLADTNDIFITYQAHRKWFPVCYTWNLPDGREVAVWFAPSTMNMDSAWTVRNSTDFSEFTMIACGVSRSFVFKNRSYEFNSVFVHVLGSNFTNWMNWAVSLLFIFFPVNPEWFLSVVRSGLEAAVPIISATASAAIFLEIPVNSTSTPVVLFL